MKTGIQQPEPVMRPPAETLAPRWAVVVLVCVAACLFAIRLTAPPNLLDQDQERPASYVLDAVRNGNWICQRDWTGDVTSKPPMWAWLASVGVLASGSLNLFALYWPGAFAGLGCGLLAWHFGRLHFGSRAGLLAGLACLLSTAGAKQFGLARTDGVFAFTVTLSALLAYRSWRQGGGWIWFWLACAAATLTKGPIGPLLAGFGLVAAFWERKSGFPQPLRGSHRVGILCFVAIVGGWFLLAYAHLGDALIQKMLGQELVGHAIQSGKGAVPGSMIYKQPLYYLGRAAPWSLFACFGLYRIWRYPAATDTQRGFERFLFCWFALGLTLFSLAPHQRADLLWPILPAGALIAGRELDRWTTHVATPRFLMSLAALGGVGLACFAGYYFAVVPRTSVVRQTLALRDAAAQVARASASEFPLTDVDAPMTFQVYLQIVRPSVSPARAVAMLQGQHAAFVATSNPGALLAALGPASNSVHVVLQTPVYERKKSVTILSNQPGLAHEAAFVFGFGALTFEVKDARLLAATEKEFRFAPSGSDPHILVRHKGKTPLRVTVGLGSDSAQTRSLLPGEEWDIHPSSGPMSLQASQ